MRFVYLLFISNNSLLLQFLLDFNLCLSSPLFLSLSSFILFLLFIEVFLFNCAVTRDLCKECIPLKRIILSANENKLMRIIENKLLFHNNVPLFVSGQSSDQL